MKLGAIRKSTESGLTTKKGEKVDDQLIFTKNINVNFDADKAFNTIVACIAVEVPKNLLGIHSPSEIVLASRACLINAFKTIVDMMPDPDLQKHLESLLIVTTDLKLMLDPRFKTEESEVMH